MGDDEVLTTGLAHQTRIALVAFDVRADLTPQMLKGGRGPGEVDARQPSIGQYDVGHRLAVAGHHVDHAVGQTRRLEQLHRQEGGEGLGRRRLPDDGVAHQRRCRRKVACDCGEVERGDRVDEALERPVVGAVPHPSAAHRLLHEDPAREGDVEPPEVDQLARCVDLRLVGRLGLPQHRGRDQLLPPWTRQQVGCPQEHRGSFVERRRLPCRFRRERRIDGCTGVVVRGVGQRAQPRSVPVGLNNVHELAVPHPVAAADDVRQVEWCRRHLGQGVDEAAALIRPGGVVVHRLVGRRWYFGDRVHGSRIPESRPASLSRSAKAHMPPQYNRTICASPGSGSASCCWRWTARW